MSNIVEFPPNEEPIRLYDVEVEAALLGAIMVRERAYFEVSRDLRPDHFYEPVHGRIFEVIGKIIDQGAQATPLTLKQYFETDAGLEDAGGGKYLYDLAAAVVTTLNAADYASTIIDYWQRRELLARWAEVSRDLQAPAFEQRAAELGARFQRDIEAVITQGSDRGRSRRDVLNDVVADLEAPVEATPTGLEKLDAAMAGGLHRGRAYGFVGRKKIGKSGLGGTISYNLNEAGEKHLVILLEMGSLSYEQRAIGRALEFNAMKFLRPDSRNDPAFVQRVANYAVTAPDHVHYLDRPGLSFEQLQQQVVYFVHRHGVKGVILDYLQLVKGRQDRRTQAEHLDDVSQWLGQITKQLGIWVVCFAQMNQDDNVRGGEGMRLAFDQVYAMKAGAEPGQMYLEQWDSRYTPPIDVGSKHAPAFEMHGSGPHFRELYRREMSEDERGLFDDGRP